MSRFRTLLLLPSTLALEVGALVVLHGLGETPPLRPGTMVQAHAPPEDVVMAAARLVALAVGWWLLATTSLCAAAHVCRLPAALRAVEPITLPAVRRLVERSIAVTLSLSAGAVTVPGAPAFAQEFAQAPAASGADAASAPGGGWESSVFAPRVEGGLVLPPALALDAAPSRSQRQPPDARPALEFPPTLAARIPGPAGTDPPAPNAGARGTDPPAPNAGARLPRQHRVAEGEHLWGLAQAVVADSTNRPAAQVPAGEVAAYWLRLIEANPSSRSGDPDVIYPGETLNLPPLDG